MIRTPDADIREGLAKDRADLVRCEATLAALEAGEKVENATSEGMAQVVDSLRACIQNKERLLVASRFQRRLARVDPRGL